MCCSHHTFAMQKNQHNAKCGRLWQAHVAASCQHLPSLLSTFASFIELSAPAAGADFSSSSLLLSSLELSDTQSL